MMRTILIWVAMAFAMGLFWSEASARTLTIGRDTAKSACGGLLGGRFSGCSYCNALRCYDIMCKRGKKTCKAVTVEQ
jgi:hypothetical protein